VGDVRDDNLFCVLRETGEVPGVPGGNHRASGQIRHNNAAYHFPKFPDSMRQLLEAGGLAQYLKAQFRDGGKIPTRD